MIAVIDYGMGNLRSVQKAFEAVDATAKITSDPMTIQSADSVVLPGVGAFKDCMDNLTRLNLVEAIHKTIKSGKPFLGICLGLQLLFDQSHEFGVINGLGVLPGKVVRFDAGNDPGMKVPHMGWNTVTVNSSSPLFDPGSDPSYFYFVHSYYVVPQDSEIIATTTRYGVEFVSGIEQDNIHAFQFHPEKSQKTGLALLRKFSQLN